MQPSEIISVNIWQILVSLSNLVILFLILKKFLYKPVKNVLKTRQESIDKKYEEADGYLGDAQKTKNELEEKLSKAEDRANEIINEATEVAQRRKEKIIDEAHNEADIIVRQAKSEAELEKKKSESEIKEQIIDVSLVLSQKLIEREIKEEDHRELIDSFITQIGEANE